MLAGTNTQMDDPTELDLYVIQPKIRTQLLAFRRLVSQEYPVRHVWGNQSVLHLCFVSMVQIKQYLRARGCLREPSFDNNTISQFSKSIISTGK